MFSTQIALMQRGQLELGVSCAPVYGETAWAERGSGAFLDGEQLAVSRIAALEQATLDRQPAHARAGPRWAALGRLVARLDRIRGFGDFLHYHLLAAGKIEAVIESDIRILDIAALTVIVEEAAAASPISKARRSGSGREHPRLERRAARHDPRRTRS